MGTNVLSAKKIKRAWHIMDAKDKILGRLAVEAANKLSGKGKTNFVPYLDNGDFVVVTNAILVKVTGNKSKDKKYVRHSGYPGGLRVETYSKLIKRRPERIIHHAVSGMLPKNKLGKKMITRLKIYPGSDHPHTKQIGVGQ